MILIRFDKNYVEITGHSNYSKAGSDIVCSAISTLTQFVAEIIKKENFGNYTVKDGYLKIELKVENEFSIKLFNYLKEAIESIQKDFPKNVKLEVK